MSSLRLGLSLLASFALLVSAGCGSGEEAASGDNAGSGGDTGTETTGSESTSSNADDPKNDPNMISIDGSSTVHPISEAVAEAIKEKGITNVEVASPSGTTGGFDKFVLGNTDINDASRPIKDEEVTKCGEANIEALELTVAIDGISIVVNKENTWCDSMTYDQLQKLWEPDSKIKTWKDLNPEWPEETIKLYGPDDKSGTFEYFTKKVVGTKKKCRSDYEPAVEDNVLVAGVAGDKYALGYFGYGYYVKNRKDLKGLSVAKGDGKPIAPSVKSIESYEYPISRPVFIYVNKNRLGDENMAEFLRFYLNEGQKFVPRVGCVQLPKDELAKSVKALEDALAAAK